MKLTTCFNSVLCAACIAIPAPADESPQTAKTSDAGSKQQRHNDDADDDQHPTTLRLYNPETQHDYQRINVAMSWHDAKKYCEKLGGHLATATTAQENEFIYNQFGRDHVVWLGATDEQEEGTWKWITEEPWEYESWFRNEPNNKGDVEHYLALGNTRSITTPTGSYFYRFSEKWNDHQATGKRRRTPDPQCWFAGS